jgi:hypothetical protein
VKNKRVFVGLALVVGFMMFGCATVATFNATLNGTETETSKMLLTAANEVLLSRESGWTYDVFKVAYETKVRGLRVSLISPASYTELSLAYQGRKYTLLLPSHSGNILTSAQKCVDVTKE